MSLYPPTGTSTEPRGARGEPVTFSSWVTSVRKLAESFLHLLVAEAKRAGISLAFMLGFGLAAAILLVTGWLALIACVVLALVLNGILGWVSTLIIAAVLSFLGAGLCACLTLSRAKDLLFRATRRQLSTNAPETESSNAKPT